MARHLEETKNWDEVQRVKGAIDQLRAIDAIPNQIEKLYESLKLQEVKDQLLEEKEKIRSYARTRN